MPEPTALGQLVCRLRLRLAALILPSGWGVMPVDLRPDDDFQTAFEQGRIW